jgi:hypothetical protein
MDCVNKVIPGRTKKDYDKVYLAQNKEVIAEKAKKYYVENKDKIAVTRKVYLAKNKEVIAEKRKAYREANLDALVEKQRRLHVCLCGSHFTHSNASAHMKTNKHQSYINSIEYLQEIHEYVQSIINKYK